eukprot:10211919-Ditylum_brightwellii.AAC.1
MNDIKHETIVYEHLHSRSVFIRVNHFGASKIASPGFLTQIHPTLTRYDDLRANLMAALVKVDIQGNAITN